MSSILKFFRITFFYAVYFFLCMMFLVVALESWPVSAQMLFAFGLPTLLVWWQESVKAHKAVNKPNPLNWICK